MPPLDKPVSDSQRLRLDLPDAELVGELLNNRPGAHRLVVERFAPLVRGLLRRSLGPRNDIDDAQQEVFWCLFRSIDTLRDPCSLRPFIMTITFRAVLHERRRRRATLSLHSVPAHADLGSTSDEAEASYALLRLSDLVLRLSERERKTFVLRFVQGMTVSEIAAALALSEATTRRSYTRAWSCVSKWAARDPFLYDYFAEALPSSAVLRIKPHSALDAPRSITPKGYDGARRRALRKPASSAHSERATSLSVAAQFTWRGVADGG